MSIIHKGDLAAKVRQAQEVLGFAKRFYDDVQEQIDSPDGPSTRAKNIRDEFLRLFEHGIGHDMPEIRHTTWTALNAVTEYVDHYRSTRGKSEHDRASNRLESAWFGSGARLKERAWELALQMAM